MIEKVGEYMYYNGRKLDNTFKYISDGTWFVKDSLCKLEDDNSNFGRQGGLFRGMHICKKGNGEVENCGFKVGEIREDGEICSWNEFDIYDNENNLIQKHIDEEN